MYSLFRSLALRLVKAPTEPPQPPAGSHGSVQVYRASPRFLTYRLLGFSLVTLLVFLGLAVLAVVGMAQEDRGMVTAALILLPVMIVVQFFVYFAVRIDYDMRYYIVTDRSLRVREGALIVREKTISFANVQNLRVVQGPLLRLLGIWNLLVDTAGGGGAEEKAKGGASSRQVQMAGIENAHEVRDLILGHLKNRGQSSGLGDLDDRDDDEGPLSPAAVAALRDLRESTAALRAVAEARGRSLAQAE
jgi:membrane protein YdbS with pleckstrin-like domain